MNQNNIKYTTYLNILHEELKPAMGCTEPIALAYAAAKARDILEAVPDRIILEVSGSIIKNVKSVIVPNTNHQKGIDTAVAAGIIAGKTEKELEVLADITPEQYDAISDYKARTPIEVIHVEHGHSFEISITVFKGNSNATVRILDYHTDIVFISKNSEVLLQKELQKTASDTVSDRSLLNIEDIWDFSQTVAIQDVKPVLDRQIQYNFAIAQEGLRGNYGANIGSVLLTNYGSDIRTKAKAYAAAGSDARMNGCDLPVVINSGSGKSGISPVLFLSLYTQKSCTALMNSSTGRWFSPTLLLFTKKQELVHFPLFVAPSVQVQVQVRVLLIFAVAVTVKLFIQLSIHLLLSPVLSVTEPKHPAPQKLHLLSMPVLWVTKCSSWARNLKVAMAL